MVWATFMASQADVNVGPVAIACFCQLYTLWPEQLACKTEHAVVLWRVNKPASLDFLSIRKGFKCEVYVKCPSIWALWKRKFHWNFEWSSSHNLYPVSVWNMCRPKGGVCWRWHINLYISDSQSVVRVPLVVRRASSSGTPKNHWNIYIGVSSAAPSTHRKRRAAARQQEYTVNSGL